MTGVYFNGMFFHHFLEQSGAGDPAEGVNIKGGADTFPTSNHPGAG